MEGIRKCHCQPAQRLHVLRADIFVHLHVKHVCACVCCLRRVAITLMGKLRRVQYSSMAIVRHGCGFGVLRRHSRLGMQLCRPDRT